ncbi:hypothetical protein BaRGS_00036264 [Batillaria attramentaria]|uniref:Small integral membrane protein 14 n=1 Tax=Batillaria attramentaria TaxID=370345 RepID=A0ABD0JCE3_9CAEN
MSDFDPCECIWNHESAMQRLINLLRNSQNTCTDTECYTDLPGQNAPDGGMSTVMMMMIGWLVVATALFLLRPPSLRERGDQKPSGPGGSGSNPPPPGPSVH